MLLFNKFLRIFIVHQVCIWLVQGNCSGPPTPPAGMNISIVLENQVVVYQCTSGLEFSSGDSVIVSDCTSDGWYPVTATCPSGNPAVQQCSNAPTTEPANATYQSTPSSQLYRAYKCNDEKKSWLSGRPMKVMSCRKGAWVQIYDICDEGCPVPRDCADVADLGLEEEGEYLVIPSGQVNGTIYKVHCLLNNTDENHGGSWTYIFRQSKDNESLYSADEYKIGYGEEEKLMGNYFIGLKFLEAISKKFSDRDIGQVMDILFYNSQHKFIYFTTYGNFTVGREGELFKLWSVGADHGPGGDGMCPIVYTNFEFSTVKAAQWWGVTAATWPKNIQPMKGNFLPSNAKWQPLEAKVSEYSYVEIRIRPIHKDRAVLCPPMIGSDISWTETNVTIPYQRKVGTVISWICIGERLYEGQGGERSKEGNITCEPGVNGGPPQWSKNITLPCTVKCPDGFMLLDDGIRCFNYSMGTAKGFIDASLQCQKLNSTLAKINTTTDLFNSRTTPYFASHAKRGTNQSDVVFSIPTTFNCSADKLCTVDDNHECAVVTKSNSYEYASCDEPFPYVCEIPSKCPFDYKLYQGTCYLVVKNMPTFKDAYMACIANGASLAYPPDNLVAVELHRRLVKDFGLDATKEQQFFIGVNKWDGTWDTEDFIMDPNFEINLNDGAAEKWRVLSLSASAEPKYIPVDLSYTLATANALCQYPGPIECDLNPPNATENMNRTWDNNTEVGSTASYTCTDGFFVNQNKSVTNQTSTCYGMLGEWYPALSPCQKTPVCNESTPTVNTSNTMNATNAESYYIGGNISYSCPSGLAFSNQSLSITVFCIKEGDIYKYNVMNILACNVCYDPISKENMTTTWTNTTKYEIGSNVTVSCKNGSQFLSGTQNQIVNCTSTGWVWGGSNEVCVAQCSGYFSYGNAYSTWANDSYTAIGASGEIKCNTGFQYLSGATALNITCSINGWNTTGLESCVAMCSGTSVTQGNASSLWKNDTYHPIGSIGQMECVHNFEYANNKTTQNVTCTKDGWNLTSLVACYAVCKDEPPTQGKNVKPFNVTSRVVGSTLTYQCEAGYFEPTVANAKPSTNITIKCNDSGIWENPLGSKPYDCIELCLDNPPATPKNAISDWDNQTYTRDTMVEYECDSGHYFGNFSSTWVVTCNGMMWEPYDAALFNCSRVCNEQPPAPQTNEEYNWSSQFGLVGQVILYKCKNFTANKDGSKNYTIQCQDSGVWTERAPNFACIPGCGGPPPAKPTGSTYNYTNDFSEGAVVNYNCPTNFMQYYQPDITITCTNGAWSLTEIPACQPEEPTVPNTPDPNAPHQSPYKKTADYIYSDIANEFVTTSGEPGGISSVGGPYGFGDAVNLDGSQPQCIKKENFAASSDICLINPLNCTEGFSVSIWAYQMIHNNTLESIDENDDPTKYQYVLSTGGDDNGHPGFVIAFQNHWLIAIVSAGPQYWKARVLGQVNSSSWINIGFVFDKQNDVIKIYVNLKLVSTANSRAYTGPKKYGLYPPELIIGCHKDNDNKDYRGHLVGMFDECAVWKKPLNGSSENYEVIKFFGGLNENKTFQTSEKLKEMLENINFKDPEQVKTATNAILEFYSKQDPTQATPTAGTTAGSINGTDNENKTVDPASVKDLKNLIDMLRFMMDPGKLGNTCTQDGLESYLCVIDLMALVFSKEKTEIWNALQGEYEDNNTYDAADLMHNFTSYQMELVKRTEFPNGSIPFCYYSAANPNMYSVTCKISLVDFLNGGKNYIQPNYQNSKTADLFTEWDDPFDKCTYFTGLYIDDRCHDRGISITFNIFEALPKFISKRLISSLSAKIGVYRLASRIVDFNIQVDPARRPNGEPDTSKPLCKPDPELLASHPILCTFEHFQKMLQIKRALLFHEKENYTNVLARRCVRWNQDYNDTADEKNMTGAWDTMGCRMVETSMDYSKCYCKDFGKYTIIAEETEPIEVKEDPWWLLITKFGLYGVSGIAVIIYVVIVILSGELKDQLHLMGLNLALALLLGSIVMVISEFDPVRVDRHMCFGVGTLIHFFYSAVGVWMFCLGHASFKAITAGIVDGRFRAYMFFCWGTPIFLTGIPYVMYLHDLGYDPRCFIGWYNKVKYIFFGPQLGCAILSFFWAIVILTNLQTHALRKKRLFADYGSFCRGCALLLIYLSVTWALGFVAYLRFGFKEPDFYPPFQIMNALSGVILLLCIGLGSNRFRKFLCCKSKEFVHDDDDFYRRNLIRRQEEKDEYSAMTRLR